MTIKDIEYERITSEFFSEEADKAIEATKKAKSGSEIVEIRESLLKVIKHMMTMSSLSHIRFTLNTKDEFYKGEKDYYDEHFPLMQAKTVEYSKVFLSSAYIADAEKLINPLIIKSYRSALKAMDKNIIPEMQEENRLVTRYSKFMSELSFNFRGDDMPLSKLKKYMSDADRATRKEAYEVLGTTMGAHKEEFDALYDSLVKIRDKMAKKMGYKNYVELGYYRMNRISFNRDMVQAFRKNVVSDLVPAVKTLKNEIAGELGIDKFMLYDNDTYFSGSEPVPNGGAKEIFEAGTRMYHEMSPQTGAFIDKMLEWDAFDTEPRDGKWGGGYMEMLPDYGISFILANFCGTSDDVDVITHEFGHAFAGELSLDVDFDLGLGGMETAETHSMSMEFFCWKYIQYFFGGRADDYKYKHLFSSLTFIPYGTMVDEFQHIVYEKPELTPDERDAVWVELEKKYRPYLTADGIPYLENGTRWQYQMHIYETPFYYIDYCLAQTTALQFLSASLKNYKKAFESYVALCTAGGSKLYGDLVSEAGLQSPFKSGALKDAVSASIETLKNLKK